MKINLTFKCPDAVSEAINDSLLREYLYKYNLDLELSELSEDQLYEYNEHKDRLTEMSRIWFRYGEYVDIEWDTDTNTCRIKNAT